MAKGYFNPQTVRTTVDSLKDTYYGVLGAVVENTQNNFINKIAVVWHGGDVVDIMSRFVVNINAKIWKTNGFEEVLSSAVRSVNSAGEAWAHESQVSYEGISFTSFSSDYKLNTDYIKEKKEDGTSGMDIDGVSERLYVLDEVVETVKSKMDSAVNAVSTSGFLEDYGIEAELVSSLTSMKNEIVTSFNTLIEDIKSIIEKNKAEKERIHMETKAAFSGNK